MPAKSTSTRPGGRAAKNPPAPERRAGARTLPVPVPELHVRHVPVPEVHMAGVTVPTVHVSVPHGWQPHLPEVSTNRVLWFGGLAALAALDVIAWPVAGVVAAGSYIAERRARTALSGRTDAAAEVQPVQPVPQPVAK